MSTICIIGIDFGTSTSVIRVKRYKEDGLPYYGYEAQKPHKKSELFQSFKVDLESQEPETSIIVCN